MASSRHLQTAMWKWYWVSKPNKLDHYLTIYENIILIGDFNLRVENTHLEATLENYDLNNLINTPTCYQSNNPTCIDLILTNIKIQAIYLSYLTLSKLVFLITISLSQLFWNQKDSMENLKKKYIDHIGNLTVKVLEKIWNLDWTI